MVKLKIVILKLLFGWR